MRAMQPFSDAADRGSSGSTPRGGHPRQGMASLRIISIAFPSRRPRLRDGAKKDDGGVSSAANRGHSGHFDGIDTLETAAGSATPHALPLRTPGPSAKRIASDGEAQAAPTTGGIRRTSTVRQRWRRAARLASATVPGHATRLRRRYQWLKKDEMVKATTHANRPESQPVVLAASIAGLGTLQPNPSTTARVRRLRSYLVAAARASTSVCSNLHELVLEAHPTSRAGYLYALKDLIGPAPHEVTWEDEWHALRRSAHTNTLPFLTPLGSPF